MMIYSATAAVNNPYVEPGLKCLYRLISTLQIFQTPVQTRRYSVQPQQPCNSTGLNLQDMPPHIILIRHGEVGRLPPLE
jgi:hypothetical protein